MMKKITAALSIIALSGFSLGPQPSLAVENPSYETEQYVLNNGVLEGDSTLVPMRDIFEALEAQVAWDEGTRRIEASKGDKVITLRIGSTDVRIDDRELRLDAAPVLLRGTTMVPLRFVSEALGAQVEWDSLTDSAIISSERKRIHVQLEHNRERIRDKWKQYKPTFTGDPYEERPNIAPPFALGKLDESYREDALKMLNFLRYLAGAPDDVVMDEELNKLSQYGAVLMAANQSIEHEQRIPSGMSASFYSIAEEALASSNLGRGYKYALSTAEKALGIDFVNDAALSVFAAQDDSDATNLATLGHRKWNLRPDLERVGFGSARASAPERLGYFDYQSTYVVSPAREKKADYYFNAWPGIGDFPSEFVYDGLAWSVLLNPEKYEEPSLGDVQIELTRASDKRMWTFDHTDYRACVPCEEPEASYFNVSNGATGSSIALIFRPDGVFRDQAGEAFRVNVTGLRFRSGQQTSISYEVRLFDLMP
ncbi:stalk domain-containing protein [Paenibacillus sp. TRM 82003]|nr:stalk domain-containing protein [Paenibacillus sp. TRM 82003]